MQSRSDYRIRVLRLHDTATRTVRPLEQRDPSEVSMYVCGPTVYGVPHLGHGRFALVFDVLKRYIEFCGTPVRYVSNITDVDDKIIARAREEGRTEEDVARQYEELWWEAMDALGVIRPDESPHATKWIDQMVSLISQLVAQESAYATDDGVYLSVEKVDGYGLLAEQDLASMRAGARVEVDEHKRAPGDFALWKLAKPGEPSWDSPFGKGRPGWHTECVVMSLGLLGDGFDLHGGGKDLAFPHHENERAQAVAIGRPFARHWVHNGWVEVEGEKMSKSLGNFTSLTDLLERSDSRAYRLLVLRAHYRSPIEVNTTTVADAEAALSRLDNLARRFDLSPDLASVKASEAIERGVDPEALGFFIERMNDDMDTPAAVACIFDLAKRANALADDGDIEAGRRLALTAAVLCGALGIELRGGTDDEPDEEAGALAAQRDEARAAGDFTRADFLRDAIRERGWEVEDSSEGTRLHRP
jgi:cysteinyl-tRNA synthetase